jgi:hypothetical protein
MRRKALRGICAGVTLCLLGGLCAAEEKDTYQSLKDVKPKKESSGSSWWWPWGSTKKAEPDPKAAAKSTTAKKAKPADEAEQVRAPAADPAALAAQERAKYFRRQEICLKLKAIAQETNDAELEREADLLEQRAWFVYEQRMAQARMPSLLPSDDAVAARKLTGEGKGGERRAADRPVHSVTARSSGKED